MSCHWTMTRLEQIINQIQQSDTDQLCDVNALSLLQCTKWRERESKANFISNQQMHGSDSIPLD